MYLEDTSIFGLEVLLVKAFVLFSFNANAMVNDGGAHSPSFIGVYNRLCEGAANAACSLLYKTKFSNSNCVVNYPY